MASIQEVIDRIPATGTIPYEEFKHLVTTDGNLGQLQGSFNSLRKGPLQLVFVNDENGLPVLHVQRRVSEEGQGG